MVGHRIRVFVFLRLAWFEPLFLFDLDWSLWVCEKPSSVEGLTIHLLILPQRWRVPGVDTRATKWNWRPPTPLHTYKVKSPIFPTSHYSSTETAGHNANGHQRLSSLSKRRKRETVYISMKHRGRSAELTNFAAYSPATFPVHSITHLLWLSNLSHLWPSCINRSFHRLPP